MSTRFFYYNLATLSTTTVTASDEDVFYPASNLQHMHTVKEWRTNDGTLSATIVFDMQTPVNVDSFLMVGNNSTGNLQVATIKVEGNPTDVWTSPGYDSGTLNLDSNELEENFYYLDIGSTQTYRYWRITVTNGTDYVGFSNCFLGEKVELTNNAFRYGWSWNRKDRSTVQEGRYGQRFIDRISDQKMITGEFEYLNTTEFGTLETLTNYCGVYRPVWLMIDVDEEIVAKRELFGGYFLFDQRPTFINSAYSLYNTKFELTETI